MNPFATRISGNSWVVPVIILSVFLLALIRMAWITPENVRSRSRYLSPDQASRIAATFTGASGDEVMALRAQVSKQQEQLTSLQNSMGSQTKQTRVLNEQLQELKVFAGLTEVEGPGVAITLRDATNSPSALVDESELAIHDEDVLKVVNELWASGAEAVSVNNLRLSVGSTIRCVGPVVLVDQVKMAPPIVIRAIGDPQTMEGGMNLPFGILDEIKKLDSSMVKMERVEKMRLPAYSGSTQRKLAVPVPTDK
ncbi:MAG: DUF881 domain-containing protein [Fimbriimonadaceae bacterium]